MFVFISLVCFLPYTLYKLIYTRGYIELDNNKYCEQNLEYITDKKIPTMKIIARMFSHSAALF
jgi:hypothetical protein